MLKKPLALLMAVTMALGGGGTSAYAASVPETVETRNSTVSIVGGDLEPSVMSVRIPL